MIKPAVSATLDEAARILKSGGLVAFPTETVYGLGADALNADAVARIFEVKRRPAFDPIIVHVAAQAAVAGLWKEVPDEARRLMDAFWPGPLTIVLPKTERVPDIVTAGEPTVAIRMPAHPVALELLRHFGGPIAAPSANPFSRTSPTSARDVADDFGDAVELIIDGGASSVGVESTVVKIENGGAVILRPGGVTAEELSRHIPLRVFAATPDSAPGRGLEAPGRLAVHYAPKTPFFLMPAAPGTLLARIADARRTAGKPHPRVGLLALDRPENAAGFTEVQVLSGRGDLRDAAKNLFAAMRKLDASDLDAIVALEMPETGLGLAVMDRMHKAAHGRNAEAFVAFFIGPRG